MPPPMPCRTLGRAARRKPRRLALAEAPIFFSVSCCVGKTLKSVHVCLQRPVFNALGAAVCRPRCLAGRWAGRRAERHVVWPWPRRRISFSLSYCVGKTLKSVNICLHWPVFNASGAPHCRPRCLAGRWAGRRAESHVAWPCRRRQIFFSVVLCWQNVKICEFMLAMPSFQCICGASVPPPMPCRTLGRAARQKAASPGPGRGLNAIFCLVLGASSVGKCVAGVKQVWQCSVLLAVWRRYELRLLQLRELFFLCRHIG